jgi:hypothetical protein
VKEREAVKTWRRRRRRRRRRSAWIN